MGREGSSPGRGLNPARQQLGCGILGQQLPDFCVKLPRTDIPVQAVGVGMIPMVMV